MSVERPRSFAVNAPTRDVLEVGGREPEPFEAIVRRRVAEQPELRRSLGGSLRAAGGFLKILATRPFDLDRALAAREATGMPGPKSVAQQLLNWKERL